jgi:putative oxidoreductase
VVIEMGERLSLCQPHALAVLRAVTALVLMQHGVQKLFMWPPSPHHPEPVPLLSLFGIGGLLEFGGGILILLGLFTRPVAFILCGQMAVAYWMFHFAGGLGMPNGWMPVVNEGDLAVVLCFVFLFLFVAGPGSFSVDGALLRRHKQDRCKASLQ